MAALLYDMNGVPVITDRDTASSRLVSIGLLLPVGSSSETERTSGISHLVEHLIFKGSQNYSAREISRTVERAGGYFNAYTSKEYTVYYINGFADNFATFADVLCDTVFHPKLLEEELEKERRVIRTEILSVQDDPDEYLQEEAEKRLFAGSSLALPVSGTDASVSGITLDDVRQFVAEQYTAGSCIISVSGGGDISALQRAFEKADARKGGSPFIAPQDVVQSRFSETLKCSVEQAYLSMIFPAFAVGDSRRMALGVVNMMLGGAMSSRLFTRIREELALCYSIDTELSLFMNGGYTAVYWSCEKKNVKKVQKEVEACLRQTMQEGFTPEELEMAKNQLRYSLLSGYDSVENRMFLHLKQYLYTRTEYEMLSVLEKIDAITLDEVNQLFREIYGQEYSLCSLLP